MSFAEDLKQARAGRTPVLHEFLTNYSPTQPRLHAFVEGDEDLVFYKIVLENYAAGKHKLYVYRCGGKARVYEIFDQITKRFPLCRTALFFVDKDLDDILGQPWPTDPRIFVTDVYSIENYLVSREALARIIDEFIEFKNVKFNSETLLNQFDRELKRFHLLVTPLMALIVYTKRAAMKPNLGDIQPHDLFAFSLDCRIRVSAGDRLGQVCRVTGIKAPVDAQTRIREVAQELKRLPPKRFVRGKFEAWFFVEFVKQLISQLQRAAADIGGRVSLRTPVEHRNIVALMSSRIKVPQPLDLFLRVHLLSEEPVAVSAAGPRHSLLEALKNAVRQLSWKKKKK